MKNPLKLALITLSMTFLAACSSPEYIISTTDGTMIPTRGKPKLDEATGMYTYKDAEGRATSIKKDDVKQVMER
ncbi:MAG: YgdI/YgdR family lipoprotein [Gammaproteobacteria bacterium]